MIRSINIEQNLDEIETENILLHQINENIVINKKDGDNNMEIFELNDILLKQDELKLYFFCSKANNFNLMKLIWEFVDLVYKHLAEYIKKKDKNNKI